MKLAIKILVCAILSFSFGIACASPLLVTELNIRPWIHYVQGPTAQMNIQVIYANFSIQNPDKLITKTGGPQISYTVVVNATNLSNYVISGGRSDFIAAKEIKNENVLGDNGSQNWFVEGAWLDGTWYNVSWVGDSIPLIENGQITSVRWGKGYWTEGVQVYDTYQNGNITATYMNMNGTWVNVTGKIIVERASTSTGFSMVSVVAQQSNGIDTAPIREYSSTGIALDSPEPFGPYQSIIRLVDQEGYFNTTWLPKESRLIVLSGSWVVNSYFTDGEAIQTIRDGKIVLKTEFTSHVPSESSFVGNTVIMTNLVNTEQKQVTLTKEDNSYIFSPQGYAYSDFYTDQWGIEAFLRGGA